MKNKKKILKNILLIISTL